MRRVVVAGVVLALLAGACSSSTKQSTAPPTSPPTTLSVADAAHAYIPRGPYPVGVTTLTLAGGVKAEVWYPAVPGTQGTDTYDVRTLVPPTVTKLLKAPVPATYTTEAQRDAAVAPGTFPLVLWSHGFASFRLASSALTSHLASWGYIVAAPDHWSRDLYHVLDRTLGGPAVDAPSAGDDLRHTRTLMTDENARPASRFAGHVDTSRIAAIGHSAGGPSVVDIAHDDGVAGYVSLASGANLGGRPTTSATVPPPPLPNKPSLFVAGKADNVAQWERVTKPAFDAAPAPSRLWLLDTTGHNAFDDICMIGGGKGIIGVAEESGLGGFLDAQPQFRSLGSDGCLPPAVPVVETLPIVRHVLVAWLRELFHTDAVPVGLGPEVSGSYQVPVKILEKLF